MIDLHSECGLTDEERQEQAFYDAVIKQVPDCTDYGLIADLMIAGLSVNEVVREIRATN